MRCADFGPTPGRQRNDWISSSSVAGFSMNRLRSPAGSCPGGRFRPAAKPCILAWVVASTFLTASFIAAITRSSSMSLSSPRSEGSMATRFTANLQVIMTFTRPAPDCALDLDRPRAPPALSSCSPASAAPASSAGPIRPSSSRHLFPFVDPVASSAGRMDDGITSAPRSRTRSRTKGSSSMATVALAWRLSISRRCLAAMLLPATSPTRTVSRVGRAEMLLQLRPELVLVVLLAVHAVRFRHDELERAIGVRSEFPVTSDHARQAGEAEAFHEGRPIAIEGCRGARRPAGSPSRFQDRQKPWAS